MYAIKTLNLTKYYGSSRGIIDLNLTVDEGDFFGFIGPNGSGKSTTIRTLLGLISATSGSAEIFGKNIEKDKTAILGSIGYLPSEAIFYAGMKVREVLKLSADLRKTDCAAEARYLCERFQLDTTRKIEELSFGNRKKVGIVCALQHKPKLLVLDEPTSGLDPLMQRVFFEVLRERNRNGTTIFLSSHVLSEIQRNCQNAAIISEGKIIAYNSVENLSKTNTKRVVVHGSFDTDMLAGIRDKKESNNSTSYLYNGDINDLIKTISKHQITDLSISEPDLEEIFMHYYINGGAEQ